MSPGPAASSSSVSPGLRAERVDHPGGDGHRGAAQLVGPDAPPLRRGRPAGPALLSDVLAHRSSRRRSFPDAVRGSVSVTSTALGTLKRASRPATHSRSSCGSAGARSTTLAVTASPHSGSGRPNTPASATAGCASSAASTSAGATFSPPVTIVSDLRPTIVQTAGVVEAAEVAGVQDAAAGDGRALDEDLPVVRERDRQPGQRAAVDRHLRAGLGEPVGGADGPAGRARAPRAGPASPPRRRAGPRAGARPGARRRPAAAAAGSGRARRRVMSSSGRDARRRRAPRGCRRSRSAAAPSARRRARAAAGTASARRDRGRARPPSRARWPGRCRSSARRAAAPRWCRSCARRARCRRRPARRAPPRRRPAAGRRRRASADGQQRRPLGLPQPRVDRHRGGAREQAGVQRDREVQPGRERERDAAAGRDVDPRRARAAARR